MAVDDRAKKFLGRAVSAFLGVAALIAAIYGFGVYVDSRVERLVHDEAFLKRLSVSVRPSCIFDQKGSIVVEMGAMDYIDSIDVTADPNGDFPSTITVHPKHYMAHAPLLSTVDPFVMTVSAERGAKFDWVYTVSYVHVGEHPAVTIRYRLEVLY